MADKENRMMIKEEGAELGAFGPTNKMKGKQVVTFDPADDSSQSPLPQNKLSYASEGTSEVLAVSQGLEPTSTGIKKKKKKQLVDTEPLDEENENTGKDLDYPSEGADRDYTYEELINRAFHNLRLAGDRRQRTVLKKPQVLPEGTKKTAFVNFMDVCKSMHRQPDHVMTYLLAELGTKGTLDGRQRLVVKGQLETEKFEVNLKRYCNEYVTCNACKSSDTSLSRENRLLLLRCEMCGSLRSVDEIKTGFVARVKKAGTTK
ncbi:Translation initiation factor IF2/IF5 [Artemisia annua]|uniref:Eukaryotic translation initiation factor 2 subunit beta n=1 Tax=Artemisia annua TaxID=35608 RepID=A0A2U1MGR9_ARTAN|nr:Translation initiation factor IF2/IF5 [Artemisia annua]